MTVKLPKRTIKDSSKPIQDFKLHNSIKQYISQMKRKCKVAQDLKLLDLIYRLAVNPAYDRVTRPLVERRVSPSRSITQRGMALDEWQNSNIAKKRM